MAQALADYKPYWLSKSTLNGQMTIRRKDPDGRSRCVAFIDSTEHFDTFVAALKAGKDEVAAVHAIDAAAR